MKSNRQRVMHCLCGNSNVLAVGLCATCYTLKGRTKNASAGAGGGSEARWVSLPGFDAPGRDKRSIVVHHRVAGRSVPNLMVSLCPACHAKVYRTKAVLSGTPPLLLELWREQHPKGHEQGQLDFASKQPLFHCVEREATRALDGAQYNLSRSERYLQR